MIKNISFQEFTNDHLIELHQWLQESKIYDGGIGVHDETY